MTSDPDEESASYLVAEHSIQRKRRTCPALCERSPIREIYEYVCEDNREFVDPETGCSACDLGTTRRNLGNDGVSLRHHDP
jgi:hypothetical protein